jgi:hypothetical protein
MSHDVSDDDIDYLDETLTTAPPSPETDEQNLERRTREWNKKVAVDEAKKIAKQINRQTLFVPAPGKFSGHQKLNYQLLI